VDKDTRQVLIVGQKNKEGFFIKQYILMEASVNDGVFYTNKIYAANTWQCYYLETIT
jgi:hypothetical protein